MYIIRAVGWITKYENVASFACSDRQLVTVNASANLDGSSRSERHFISVEDIHVAT